MTDMRTLVLDRVRTALSDVPVDETPDDVSVPREYRRAGARSPDTRLVDLFAERAADYRAQVTRVAEGTAAKAVAEILAERNPATLLVPPGFPERHLTDAAGPAVLHDEPALSPRSLDLVQAVITVSALAIAETGTVILDGSAGQGRRALTLLPDFHLCLVHADAIVETVPDALCALDPRRPLTMVSGPSATSDIENSRVEGVHGPRTLHILIIEPDDSAGEREQP